ncbi:MAG: FAD-dependent oxidoreductase [Deltaproteobacteria bacterium]|nr:FAD-dependent oxidoreductase [Deltaproteobacteria bacterium]
MKSIEEVARTTPVLAETDVLVVGSGPGGLSAALAASREGVSTMLVERHGCFGGNITQANVESIAWYRHEQTVEANGIGMELERRAQEMGATQPEPQSTSQALDTDLFRWVADKIVEDSAIVPLLHCFAVDVIMNGDAICGIITESKSGRQAILANQIIDATGDADIVHRSGAPYRMAVKEDLMAVTVSFGCSGVNKDRFLEYVNENPCTLKDWAKSTTGKEDDLFSPFLREPFSKATAAGEIPKVVGLNGTWSRLTEEGEATYLNLVYMKGFDPTDVWDLTRGEMEGRQQAMWALAALKKYAPGFEKARLRSFGSSLGTRESRKIVGNYFLTEEDVRNQAKFDDSIGIFPEFLDAGVVIIPTTGRYFQVPYGIMVPQKVDNLLVAGRCVAGDKVSHAATRQMMCCTVTGQGAGVAAAISIKEKTTCRNVDIKKVQIALQKQGVRVQ